jgi:hypothetical protein
MKRPLHAFHTAFRSPECLLDDLRKADVSSYGNASLHGPFGLGGRSLVGGLRLVWGFGGLVENMLS